MSLVQGEVFEFGSRIGIFEEKDEYVLGLSHSIKLYIVEWTSVASVCFLLSVKVIIIIIHQSLVPTTLGQLHEFRFTILIYLGPNPRIGCTSSHLTLLLPFKSFVSR